MKKLLVISMCLFLFGCVMKDYSKVSQSEISNQVKIKDSAFDSSKSYIGPEIRILEARGPLAGPDSEDYFIRGWKHKETLKIMHQLYVKIGYPGEWRFYKLASAEGGAQLDVTVINRKVDYCLKTSCTYEEIIGVNMNTAFLERCRKTGLRIRLDAKSGHQNIIEVSANYVNGYLDAILSDNP